MLSMDVVFTQILVILLYILVGYGAGKWRLIDPEQRKYLTALCTNLILPFTILSASNQTLSLSQIASLGLSLALMLGLFIATTCAVMLLQRGAPRPARVTMAALITYPNCTFLGLPLCRALFGDIAILYNAVMMVAFNLLFFTWQVSAFTGKAFLEGGEVDSYGDHRIAMSAAIASCLCREPVYISNPIAVTKSYPDFYKDFDLLGGVIEY